LARAGEINLRFDQRGASLRVLHFLKIRSQFEPADGVDPHFESRDAEQTPFGVGERLHEIPLFVSSRSVAFLK
jgi:hypothetical protein